MERGTVKWFNAEKGFGFITPLSGGEDVFLSASVLESNVHITEGASVLFEREVTPKAVRALRVSLLS